MSQVQEIEQLKQQVQRKLLKGLGVALDSSQSYRADVVSAYVSAYCMLADSSSVVTPPVVDGLVRELRDLQRRVAELEQRR